MFPVVRHALWLKTASNVIAEYTEHRLEFVSSLSLILLGFWFLFLRNPLSYLFLTTIAPLWAWGLFLIALGFATRVGMWKKNRNLRQLCILCILAVRTLLFGGVAYSTRWGSTTLPEHLSWIFVSLWAFYRAGKS